MMLFDMTGLPIVVGSVVACTATIGAYLASCELQKGFGGTIWLQPILVAIMILGGGVAAIGMSHERFFEAAYPLHWLVGPMTALLAIPLYCQIRKIGSVAVPVLGILFVGSFSAMMSGAAAAITTGSDAALAITLAPKSVTTAIAIGISESLGGVPGITAVVVILTAVVGVTAAPLVFRCLDIRDERAQGLALGITAHALGTARAFQISESAGAFASVGMILNALATVALVAALAQTL